MNDRQLRDALAHVDPARHLDPPVPEDLLRRVKAGPVEAAAAPATRRPRRVTWPRLAVASATAVAALAVLAAGGQPLDHGAPASFGARAYAAAAPPAGRVLHTRIRTTETRADGLIRAVRTDEWWLRPGEAGYVHVIVQSRPRPTRRLVIAADRTRRTTWQDGRVLDVAEGRPRPDREGVFDPDALFRRLYDRGVLRDGGPASSDGRPVRRFVGRDGVSEIVYDLDPDTLRTRRTTVALVDPDTGRRRYTAVHDVELLGSTRAAPDPQELLQP